MDWMFHLITLSFLHCRQTIEPAYVPNSEASEQRWHVQSKHFTLFKCNRLVSVFFKDCVYDMLIISSFFISTGGRDDGQFVFRNIQWEKQRDHSGENIHMETIRNRIIKKKLNNCVFNSMHLLLLNLFSCRLGKHVLYLAYNRATAYSSQCI